jgi:hypothetical protein
MQYRAAIASDNAAAPGASVQYCQALGIGAFRSDSQILPLGTHPISGYTVDWIDRQGAIREAFLCHPYSGSGGEPRIDITGGGRLYPRRKPGPRQRRRRGDRTPVKG